MVSMSSTLVETVSINYEDFNESFLTCGTCLCMYDGQEHTPKLLPCSHTVCLHCLGRIAASQTRDTGSFRCPICRELIHIPRGGVSAIPPSFLVNQLLDLMSRQRREVVPKCSEHINQELLFCETCDTVFCSQCARGSDGGHGSSTSDCEHTVVPFGIAMKRMSEILLYRANECAARLQAANESVGAELARLEQAAQTCRDQVDATFGAISDVVAARRAELTDAIAQAAKDKRRVLEEQMALIDAEKAKVERDCEGLQQQVEVRSITQRIAGVQRQLEAASLLAEPRENAFLACDLAPTLPALETALAALGRVRSSTTFPALCSVRLERDPVVQLEATAIVKTVDYHGNPRTTGGDPISVSIKQTSASPPAEAVDATVEDCQDGSYRIRFRPPTPGDYDMQVSVLERPIKRCPASLRVSRHNEPIAQHGGRGSGRANLLQPVGVAVDGDRVFVLDTGNSRIKRLDQELQCVECIENEGLEGRSCTGIAVSSRGLVVVNWRSRVVTEMTFDGATLWSFTHAAFVEPIAVAVDNAGYGHVMVADNGVGCVFVFDARGKFLFQVGKKGSAKGSFNLISSVAVGPLGEIIVADSRIQVFSAKGDFLHELYAEGKGRGRYGGVVADGDDHVIATRCDKSGSAVQVLRLSTGELLATLDSHDSKLKRASGLAVLRGNHVAVVDLGNDAVKKYRYW